MLEEQVCHVRALSEGCLVLCASPYKLVVLVLIPLKVCAEELVTALPAPSDSTALMVYRHISVPLPEQVSL